MIPTDRPTLQDQLTAWTLAHRAILAYLVKAIAIAVPEEGTASALNATATMLNNSFAPMLANLDEDSAALLTALAQQEVDRILIAPIGDAPPSTDV